MTDGTMQDFGREAGIEAMPHSVRGKGDAVRRFLLVLTVAVTPVFLIAGFKILHTVLANQAQASVSEDVFETGALADTEQRHDAELLRGQLAQDPLKIRDLNRGQILLLLNQPSLRQIEGAFRHWQYQSSYCVLDIFFKEDKDGEIQPVRYADFHPRRIAWYGTGKIPHATGSVDERECLGSLENGH